MPNILTTKLPSFAMSPWSASNTWIDSFKAYLTPLADKASALVVLVNSGIQTTTAWWSLFPIPVQTALKQIDLLAPNVTNTSTAQAQLAPILQTLQAAVNPPHDAALAPFPAPAPASLISSVYTAPPDTRTLQVRLLRNTLWVWWLVAIIALAGGYYSQVLQNLGFGSGADYMKCFFWGLGFSVAGTQLDQLTQSAVTGNFGITIPKA